MKKSKKIDYLYLGQECVVRGEDIIGIFDMDNTTVSRHTRGFLNRAEKQQQIVNLAPDIPESYIVCNRAVYLAQQSPRALAARKFEP